MTLLTAMMFSLVIVQLPGQNVFQTFTLKQTEAKQNERIVIVGQEDLPVIKNTIIPPEISAQAAIVIDVPSAVVLYEKNADQQLMPASTTKIMTALVALENYDLEEVITIKDEQFSIGSRSDLVAGERITVENALKALLIGSGNDAALALGQHHPRGYNYFVSLMNQKANELHLTNSHFSNVSGVEQVDHYVTVRDLATLTKEAIKQPIFKQIVATKTEIITNVEGTIEHPLENTNELLGKIEGVDGVKTGWTTEAGECLVTHVSRNGRQIITVVLASNDRFGESSDLINWTFDHATWHPFPSQIIQPLPVPMLDQLPAQRL